MAISGFASPSDDRFIHEVLMRDQTATTLGVWYNLKGLHPVVVTIEGTFVADVEVVVSADTLAPSDTAVATAWPRPSDATITAAKVVQVDAAYNWIKVMVPAYTSGSINAFLLSGRGPR